MKRIRECSLFVLAAAAALTLLSSASAMACTVIIQGNDQLAPGEEYANASGQTLWGDCPLGTCGPSVATFRDAQGNERPIGSISAMPIGVQGYQCGGPGAALQQYIALDPSLAACAFEDGGPLMTPTGNTRPCGGGSSGGASSGGPSSGGPSSGGPQSTDCHTEEHPLAGTPGGPPPGTQVILCDFVDYSAAELYLEVIGQ